MLMVPISAIIPTYNRARLIRRAIASVQSQTYAAAEIVVVDDASTDDTEQVVRALGDERIRYHRLEEKGNAAFARNVGVQQAQGRYVAFLDSDDEWLPTHLERKAKLLSDTSACGVFGSFYLAFTAVTTEYRCTDRPPQMPMAEYILASRLGDARTSSFVFQTAALRQVMFDGSLLKHQDWDLAIRFADRFSLVCDTVSTVIIHPEADPARMSFRMNHSATEAFLRRHEHRLTPRTKASVYTFFAQRTFQAEGRTAVFTQYLRQALRYWPAATPRDRFVMSALVLPGVDRLFVSAGGAFARLWRRRRGGEVSELAGDA